MTIDDTIRGLEDELLAGLNGLPAGPWKVYDGCSWRRIGTAHGKYDDCGVLYPYKASDGWPDLASRQGDTYDVLNHFARCSPETIRAIIEHSRSKDDALRTALAQLDEARAELAMWQEVKHSTHWKARAEAAEARLEEAKAVLGPFAARAFQFAGLDAEWFCSPSVQVKHLRAARAFLHQGGSDAV